MQKINVPFKKTSQENPKRRFIGFILTIMLIASIFPMNISPVEAASSSTCTVSTPKQLKKAVKNGAEEVILQTNKSGTIKIPKSASGNSTTLIIDAPKAKISNSATFESLDIKRCKSYTEKATDNNIIVEADKIKLIFKPGTISTATIKKANSKITLIANKQTTIIKDFKGRTV